MPTDYINGLSCSQLLNEVSRNLGWGDNPTTTQIAVIEKHLNAAQKLICRRGNFSYLLREDSTILLTPGTNKYLLPKQVKQVVDARLIDDTCYQLDKCDSGWTKNGANSAVTYDTTYIHDNQKSLKITISGACTGVIAYSTPQTAINLSSFTSAALGFWLYSDLALDAGAYAITLTSSATGDTNATSVTTNLPAVSAYTWNYIRLTGLNCTNLTGFTTIGLRVVSDPYVATSFHLYLSNIHLYKASYGGNNWPVNIRYPQSLDRYAPCPDYYPQNRPYTMTFAGAPNLTNGRGFELFPIPDSTYPLWIRYYKWPDKLDYSNNPNGVSELENLDDIIIAVATWYTLIQERSWASAGQWEGIFRRLLAEGIDSDSRSDGWTPVMEGHNIHEVTAFNNYFEVPSNTQEGSRDGTTGFFYLD